MTTPTLRQAAQTALTELLYSIPEDARAIYEHSQTESSSIPYGRLAQEAAAEIERLLAALAAPEPATRDHQVLRLTEQLQAAHAEIVALKADAESLAMMIRVLVSALKKHWPHAPQDGDLPSRAVGLLKSKNLLGSPLRESEPDDRAMQTPPRAPIDKESKK